MVNGLGIISGQGLKDIHRPCTMSSEWGQRWNFFKLCLYASKFDIVRRTHTLMVCKGFKTQGSLPSPHNIQDRPSLHQRSSCSLIVIVCHSHLFNICRNSLEMSWNFQHAHHQCHPPTPHTDRWIGPMLKFLQNVIICIETLHCYTRSMIPWWYGKRCSGI